MILASMHGKLALVSASTKGIGKACVDYLLEMGLDVLAMGRNSDELHKLAHQFQEKKSQTGWTNHLYTLCADHSRPEEVEKKLGQFLEVRGNKGLGGIDILIHVSGGPKPGELIEATPLDLLEAFTQHVLSAQVMVKLVLPQMKKNHWGRIIPIISTSVKTPLPNLGVSNVIRGAMSSWTKTLANELGPFGICVNSILPGYIETDRLKEIISQKALKTKSGLEHVAQSLKEQVPAKRFGDPRELASVVGFLCSPSANYINGTSIPVDGGRTPSF